MEEPTWRQPLAKQISLFQVSNTNWFCFCFIENFKRRENMKPCSCAARHQQILKGKRIRWLQRMQLWWRRPLAKQINTSGIYVWYKIQNKKQIPRVQLWWSQTNLNPPHIRHWWLKLNDFYCVLILRKSIKITEDLKARCKSKYWQRKTSTVWNGEMAARSRRNWFCRCVFISRNKKSFHKRIWHQPLQFNLTSCFWRY